MPNTFLVKHQFTQNIVTPYSAIDALEGIITLAGLGVAGGTLHSLVLFNREAQTPSNNFHLFAASPDASTVADNDAFVIADADDAFYIATIPLGNWLDVAAKKVNVDGNLGIAIPQTKSGNVFLVAEFRAAYTPTDVDALRLILGILPG